MSILLDALRKSEAQRRQGSVPDLSTPVDVLPAASNPSRWLPLVPTLVAMLLIAWLGWQQYQRPPASLARTVQDGPDSRPDTSGAVRSQPTADTQGSHDSRDASLAETPAREQGASVKDYEPPALSAVSQGGTGPEEPDQNSTVRPGSLSSYRAPQTSSGRAAVVEPTRPERSSQSQAAMASSSGVSREASMAVAADVGESEAGKSPEPVSSGSSASDSGAGQTSSLGLISYWQIPESLREGLPELRLSVLVFAQQAENRFILLNGQRMQEGDSLDGGLRLEEIQRDMAVFSYRNYRFYLKS